MSRAKEGALDALHAAVATVLTEAVQVHERPILDKEGQPTGETERVAPSPQMIAQAIKFLKDNGIDAPAKSERMSNLAAALADLDVDELASELPN